MKVNDTLANSTRAAHDVGLAQTNHSRPPVRRALADRLRRRRA